MLQNSLIAPSPLGMGLSPTPAIDIYHQGHPYSPSGCCGMLPRPPLQDWGTHVLSGWACCKLVAHCQREPPGLRSGPSLGTAASNYRWWGWDGYEGQATLFQGATTLNEPVGSRASCGISRGLRYDCLVDRSINLNVLWEYHLVSGFSASTGITTLIFSSTWQCMFKVLYGRAVPQRPLWMTNSASWTTPVSLFSNSNDSSYCFFDLVLKC